MVLPLPKTCPGKVGFPEGCREKEGQWNVFSIRAATQQYDLLLVSIFWEMNIYLGIICLIDKKFICLLASPFCESQVISGEYFVLLFLAKT